MNKKEISVRNLVSNMWENNLALGLSDLENFENVTEYLRVNNITVPYSAHTYSRLHDGGIHTWTMLDVYVSLAVKLKRLGQVNMEGAPWD